MSVYITMHPRRFTVIFTRGEAPGVRICADGDSLKADPEELTIFVTREVPKANMLDAFAAMLRKEGYTVTKEGK